MEGAAQTIVSNIGQLVGEEYGLLRAIGGEVAELRDELATMNALLRMQSEAEDGAVDHFVREWMKQVRELAYDAEDCVDLYVFRIKCRPGDGFLVWSRRMLATLFPRRVLAGKIKALRVRAVTISERHARYGVGREALRRSSPPVAAVTASAQALRPANVDRRGRLVGIQDQANTLAAKVKAMNEQEEVGGKTKNLQAFSIVGFAGLGKTTLAMEVCRLLEPEFSRQAVVSVSQAFDGGKDVKALLKRVLQEMHKTKAERRGIKEEDSMGDGIDRLDVDELASKLQDLLHDKRYLIVIDDVWTIAAWGAIRSKLPDSKCGSRIIVTTRIETVAKECSEASAHEDYIHHMQPLKYEDSKLLFLSRAFRYSIDDASYTGELKVIADNILKKCAGLPLAIVSIAGLLASYRYPESKDMWETVYKSIGSQMDSNPTLEGMRRILTLSFNHLPYHLKSCMMYLSIFPEDYDINTDRLLYRWIAEGLVEEKRGLTLMEVAEGYFDELLGRSMIDTTSPISYSGRREACRVHDMMLEVMVSKSLEANFVSLLGGQYEGMSYDRIRRMSIQRGSNDESLSKKRAAAGKKKGSIERVDVHHVRSLSMFEIQGKKLFDRLAEFTLLRVLDLENCKGLENKHVKDICRMYLLRFLSMKGTDISVLPKEVGELGHLQVLNVDQTYLKELPETMTRLEKLEHVKFRNKDDWRIFWNPTRGLRKMQALRQVDWILLNNDKVAQEIGELGHLQEISIYVKSPDSKNQDILDVLVDSLSKLYSLRNLSIGRFKSELGHHPKLLNFLMAMPSPPRLLRDLHLDGTIDEFPSWVTSLHYLVNIGFIWSHLKDDQVFGVLCKLPCLQNIHMWRDSYVDTELVARTTHDFPVLRNLYVSSIHAGFPRVLQFEKGSMDKLEKLSVDFGGYEISIDGILHLNNLKEVNLVGSKNNSALSDALDQLKGESERRLDSNQFEFTVGVRYN